MQSKLCRTAVVFTLVLVIASHWFVWQSVAWVGMVIKYAQDSSLVTALEMTFDGQHPCQLCKFVTEGKKSSGAGDEERNLSTTKFDMISWGQPMPLATDVVYPLTFLSPSLTGVFPPPPPTPPPNLA